jgi:hypothetical protein
LLDTGRLPREGAAVRSSLFLAAAAAPLLAACSSPTPLSLIITAGQETDAFTACDVNNVDITITSLDGSINLTQSDLKPGASFDFGDIDGTEQITIAVVGFDASNAIVMEGSSLAALLPDSFQGGIPVFVECVHQWARPPGGLEHSHMNGVAFVQTEQYLDLTSGTAPNGAPTTDTTAVDAYDMATLAGASTVAFDVVPQTAVSIGNQVLLIDAASATWVDFSAQDQTDNVTPPTGLTSFGDVAGGQVIAAPDNSAGTARWFVVGGTRLGSATASVLEVDGDETLIAHTLLTPRAGAAAAWIKDVGLVVAGGSADPTYPGVEFLADGAPGFATTSFPTDPTTGAGAVYDGDNGVVLFGGLTDGDATGSMPQVARWIPSLTCTPTATTSCLGNAPVLPAALTNVSAYAVGAGTIVVVGSEIAAPFLDRTFFVRLAPSAVVELPLREPRSGATPLPTPVGSLAMLGGQHTDGTPATNVELLFPTTTLPTTQP